jgi:hypothetical protein
MSNVSLIRSPSAVSSYYSDLNSNLTSTLSSATTNQLNNNINLAADAAAARIKTERAAAKKPTPSGGQNLASKNIDGVLAALNGHPIAPAPSGLKGKFNLNSYLGSLDKIMAGSAAGHVPATPTGKNFSISSYMATLDKITSRPPPAVNVST